MGPVLHPSIQLPMSLECLVWDKQSVESSPPFSRSGTDIHPGHFMAEGTVSEAAARRRVGETTLAWSLVGKPGHRGYKEGLGCLGVRPILSHTRVPQR